MRRLALRSTIKMAVLTMHTSEVTFVTTKELSASIRIEVKDKRTFSFIHLPPLHRLRDAQPRVLEALAQSPRHRLRLATETGEPIVTELDGIDMTSLWDFIDTKEAINQAIARCTVDRQLCEQLAPLFSPYDLGVACSCADIGTLLDIAENASLNAKSTLNNIAFKLLLDIANRWFSGVCVSPRCVAIPGEQCTDCHQPLCSSSACREAHTEACWRVDKSL